MRHDRHRNRVWGWGGFVAGAILAFGGLARAKFQCPSAPNIGRTHVATPISAVVDGRPVAIPSATEAPLLATRVFKTEYDEFPDTVHAEVFDSFYPTQVRIVHLTRQPQ